jgi:glycosyltransferase involved in cell wall biosynthesis
MLLAEPYDPDMPARPAVMEISAVLTEHGHRVIWVMPSESGAKSVNCRWYNSIRVFTIPVYSGSSLVGKILAKVSLTIREIELADLIIRECKCDIIQAREDIAGGLAACCLKHSHHIPFVFQYSFPFVDSIGERCNSKMSLILRLVTFTGNWLLSRIMHRADMVLPVSEWMKSDLADKGISRDKLLSIPLGVNTSLFSPTNVNNSNSIRSQYRLGNSKVILYVGTLDKLRQPNILVHILVLVRKTSKVKMLVVGCGDGEQGMRELSQHYGLCEDITFAGKVPYTSVPEMIAVADICLSPVPPIALYTANSPSKMFEYMSMEKPVVANTGIYEHDAVLAKSGGGVLVPFDAESFADAIIGLLDTPALAADMGRKGREWVINNRSYDTIASRVEKMYLTLTERMI